MLILYSLAAIMSSGAWICFVPLTTVMNENAYRDASRLEIDYLNFIYLLMYIPVNFIAVFIIEKQSMRTAMLIGAFF